MAKVKLNQTQLRLVTGKSTTLADGVYYTDARIKPSYSGKVTWKSSNKKIATVSSTGVVKAKMAGRLVAKAKGTATIKVKAGGKTKSYKVSVK